MVPLPSARVPFQTAEALRVVTGRFLSLGARGISRSEAPVRLWTGPPLSRPLWADTAGGWDVKHRLRTQSRSRVLRWLDSRSVLGTRCPGDLRAQAVRARPHDE